MTKMIRRHLTDMTPRGTRGLQSVDVPSRSCALQRVMSRCDDVRSHAMESAKIRVRWSCVIRDNGLRGEPEGAVCRVSPPRGPHAEKSKSH